MRYFETDTYYHMSRMAANIISAQIITKPDCVLGLATGSTPIGIYKQLIEWYKKGDLDFSDAASINLDEYLGLDGTNDQSYRYFMNKNLFDRVNINKENTNVPDGKAENAESFCRKYEDKIDELGGADVQILGIGRNGHIGFNEPDSVLVPTTHLTSLTESTVEANARFFASEADVPRHAITMGMRSIFKAKKIIVLANGESKADAVKAMLEGISTKCPASLLCLHPNVVLICDKAAYSKV